MSTPLKIIFMGTPEFAVNSLVAINESKHKVSLVVTGTDKKRSRGNKTSPTPVKEAALTLGLPVFETDSTKTMELHNEVAKHQPDLIVVVAYKILPDSLLEIPKFGAVNLHASLLPKYRGAAPIHHAVMNGEKETGCTVFKLDSGIDTGGIIHQLKIGIDEDETTGSVYSRLMESGAKLLVDAINLLAEDNVVPKVQDDTKATPAPKIFDTDCVVNFDQRADKVHNQIRGLSPYPCAYTTLEGKKFKLFSSTQKGTENLNLMPGEIQCIEGKVFVGTKTTPINLLEVQIEGRRRMNAIEFFRGFSGKLKFSNI